MLIHFWLLLDNPPPSNLRHSFYYSGKSVIDISLTELWPIDLSQVFRITLFTSDKSKLQLFFNEPLHLF